MKKILIWIITAMSLLGLYISAQATVIWDFESAGTSPAFVQGIGYAYSSTTSIVSGKGIGASKALVLYAYAHTRNWGSGVILLPSSALNLTSTPYMYGWIAADTTSTFGAAFEVRDTTAGNQFIPPQGPYTTNGEKLSGAINGTFQKVQFDLRTFKRYLGTGAPSLSAITAMNWILPSNVSTTATSGPVHFYLDNIGAAASAAVDDWTIMASPTDSVMKLDTPAISNKENYPVGKKE